MLGASDLDAYIVSPAEQIRRVREARARLRPSSVPAARGFVMPDAPPVHVDPPAHVLAALRSVVTPVPRPGRQQQPRRPRTGGSHVLASIIGFVALHYGYDSADLLSARRGSCLVRARHIAMWVASSLSRYSLPQMGKAFGGKDHTSVLHAVRRVQTLRDNDFAFRAETDAVRAAWMAWVAGKQDGEA